MSETTRLENLLSMLQNSPGESFILFAIAKEYEGLNDLENALSYYLKILEYDPDYVGMYFHLAALYVEFEDFDNAFNIYDRGMEVATKLKDLHALSELKSAKFNLELEM